MKTEKQKNYDTCLYGFCLYEYEGDCRDCDAYYEPDEEMDEDSEADAAPDNGRIIWAIEP